MSEESQRCKGIEAHTITLTGRQTTFRSPYVPLVYRADDSESMCVERPGYEGPAINLFLNILF